MGVPAHADPPEEAGNTRRSLLLAAMFVLVVDTSRMVRLPDIEPSASAEAAALG